MRFIEAESYKLEIGSILDSSFQKLLDDYKNASKIILVDENTHDHCLSYLITSFEDLSEAEVIMFPEGEENKQMSISYNVWEALTEYGVGRYDLIINLGGGVVTDMGGFIASCYKRGVNFVNIPTSLLGMVDASLGGKTGINLGEFKNQIGVFSNPLAVFIDPIFLGTLPEEELMSGYAEMLKHGLISNKSLFEDLMEQIENFSNIDEELLVRCIHVKNDVVKQDPFEKGPRKTLNFGHTIGHVIEGYFMNAKQFTHGHAVAIGMIMEAYLSVRIGRLSAEDYMVIENALASWYPFPKFNDDDINAMIEMLDNDKKNKGGKILCVVLDEIGKCSYDVAISPSLFLETFLHFKNKQVNLN